MFKLKRPSPAMVVAVLALFVGLGGGAYAAKKIGTNDIKNSAVRSKKINDTAVNSNKIKNGAVTSKKIKNGSVKGEDLAGGMIYDYGEPTGAVEPPFDEGSNSENIKSFFAECPEGKVPVTGGAWITQFPTGSSTNPDPEKIIVSESYPLGSSWYAAAIEVNGGTSEDWRLVIQMTCGKVADG